MPPVNVVKQKTDKELQQRVCLIMLEKKEYYNCTDEELVMISRGGDSAATDFLMEKYKPLVRKKAREFHMAGGDTEDLIQEGMLGLFKALRDYDAGKGASFSTFANLCISRQLYSAAEAAGRQKHKALNDAVPYDDALFYNRSSYGRSNYGTSSSDYKGIPSDEEPTGAGDTTTAVTGFAELSDSSPEEQYISEESRKHLEDIIRRTLSPFEQQVLDLYLSGSTYTEIAKELGRDSKSTDNALQRIRAKVRKLLNEKD